MADTQPMMFIHGLYGSSQGFKARLLRSLFPEIEVPDFEGDLESRMALLEPLLARATGWILIGSSFGGLMSALYTCQHPERVARQVLLAPALVWPDFASQPPDPVPVPTVVYHGAQDAIIPLEVIRPLAEHVFTNLEFHVVDDDHSLHPTVEAIDWPALLRIPRA